MEVLPTQLLSISVAQSLSWFLAKMVFQLQGTYNHHLLHVPDQFSAGQKLKHVGQRHCPLPLMPVKHWQAWGCWDGPSTPPAWQGQSPQGQDVASAGLSLPLLCLPHKRRWSKGCPCLGVLSSCTEHSWAALPSIHPAGMGCFPMIEHEQPAIPMALAGSPSLWCIKAAWSSRT